MLNQMSSHRLVPNLNLWCHHILPLTCIKPERVWYLLKKKNSMKMVSSMFNMLPCWCGEGEISETIWGLVFENSTVSNSSIECSTNWLKGNGFSTKGFWWKQDLGERWDRKNHPRPKRRRKRRGWAWLPFCSRELQLCFGMKNNTIMQVFIDMITNNWSVLLEMKIQAGYQMTQWRFCNEETGLLFLGMEPTLNSGLIYEKVDATKRVP